MSSSPPRQRAKRIASTALQLPRGDVSPAWDDLHKHAPADLDAIRRTLQNMQIALKREIAEMDSNIGPLEPLTVDLGLHGTAGEVDVESTSVDVRVPASLLNHDAEDPEALWQWFERRCELQAQQRSNDLRLQIAELLLQRKALGEEVSLWAALSEEEQKDIELNIIQKSRQQKQHELLQDIKAGITGTAKLKGRLQKVAKYLLLDEASFGKPTDMYREMAKKAGSLAQDPANSMEKFFRKHFGDLLPQDMEEWRFIARAWHEL